MRRLCIILFFIQAIPHLVFGLSGDTLNLRLCDVVTAARLKSPDALAARHSFRAEYWNYRYFKANYLPALNFVSTPTLNRSINKITLPDGSDKFVEQNLLTTDATLSLSQNISLTGGTVFLKTSVERLDLIGEKSHSYNTTPVLIGYQQNLFGYNSLRWDKRIEPIRYVKAKKEYVETLELVAATVTRYFFDLAMAQTNLKTACYNYAIADTLYRYAEGRYNIGTITQNDMLQLEINKLNEQTNMINAQIQVDNCSQTLQSYLNIDKESVILVSIDSIIPRFSVDISESMSLAFGNNPDIQSMEIRRLESERQVAVAKSQRGLKADVYMQFGLVQTSNEFSGSYRNPLDQQYVQLGIQLPIVDWGRGKGRVKVALSNRDMVTTRIEQEKNTFEQNIFNTVKQFNLQSAKVEIARKTDITTEKRHDVARRLYFLGKSTILDLNAAILAKDTAKRAYISALYSFWNYYYAIRSLTLYDFENDIPLTEDYSLLLQ